MRTQVTTAGLIVLKGSFSSFFFLLMVWLKCVICHYRLFLFIWAEPCSHCCVDSGKPESKSQPDIKGHSVLKCFFGCIIWKIRLVLLPFWISRVSRLESLSPALGTNSKQQPKKPLSICMILARRNRKLVLVLVSSLPDYKLRWIIAWIYVNANEYEWEKRISEP